MPGIFIFNYSLLIKSGFAQVMTYCLVLERRKRALSFLVVKFIKSLLQVFVEQNPASELGNGTAGGRTGKVSQCKVGEINSVHNVCV